MEEFFRSQMRREQEHREKTWKQNFLFFDDGRVKDEKYANRKKLKVVEKLFL